MNAQGPQQAGHVPGMTPRRKKRKGNIEDLDISRPVIQNDPIEFQADPVSEPHLVAESVPAPPASAPAPASVPALASVPAPPNVTATPNPPVRGRPKGSFGEKLRAQEAASRAVTAAIGGARTDMESAQLLLAAANDLPSDTDGDIAEGDSSGLPISNPFGISRVSAVPGVEGIRAAFSTKMNDILPESNIISKTLEEPPLLKAWRRLYTFSTDLQVLTLENERLLLCPEGWVAIALAERLSPSSVIVDPQCATVPSAVYRFSASLGALVGPAEVTPELINRFRNLVCSTYYLAHDRSLSEASVIKRDYVTPARLG